MNKLVSLLVISGFVLAGCKQAPSDEPESDRQVDIRFSVSTSSNSSLKSSGTVEEDAIGEITLYGVNAGGAVVRTFPDVYITSTGDTTLSMPASIVSLYAIANSTADMDIQTHATAANLTAMTCDYAQAPESPFVMSGNGAVIIGLTDNTASIDLVRSIAKIVVAGEGGFVVDSIKVNNTPDQGFVLAQSSLAVPSSVRVDYDYIESDVCYVPENTTSDPTTLTVMGTYNSSDVEVPINFIVSGSPVPIERNKCYWVTIAPSPGHEVIVTIEIIDWDDEDIDTHYFDF